MSDRALDGRHESLSRIFGNESHFLIDMTRNLRGYSWPTDRVARLVDDIDSFRPDVDNEDDTYDLGQVIFTKVEKKDQTLDQQRAVCGRRDCSWYYVHDGQQRLCTTYILLLAIVPEIDARKRKGKIPAELQRKFDTLREDLAKAVKPRTRGGFYYSRIVSNVSLLTEIVNSIRVKDGPEEEAIESPAKKPRVEPPTSAEDKEEDSKPPAAAVRSVVSVDSEECTTTTTAPPADMRTSKNMWKPRHRSSAAAAAEQDTEEEDPEERKRVQEAFAKCKEILGKMDTNKLGEFCEKILDFTSVLVCVATSTKIADRLVMGQRHGMDIEEVDYCKGYLCRNEFCPDDTASQRKTERRWRDLCSATSRQAVLSAALSVAQISMGELARGTEGKDAVDFFEKFVKDKFTNHQERATESCCGAIFTSISKAASIIHNLGKAAKSGSESDIAGLYNGIPAMTPDIKEQSLTSMRFLVGIVGPPKPQQTAAGKAVQLALVAALLTVDTNPNCLRSLLYHLEHIALLLVLTSAKKERSDRVLEFIKQIGHQSTSDSAALSLEPGERRAIRDGLQKVEFSDNNRIPKAILERLNFHEQQKEDVVQVWEEEVFLDVMRPGAKTSKHCLGNFVLSATKPATRNRGRVSTTKARASRSAFPLSRWAASLSWENDRDTEENIKENTKHIVKVANEVWGLSGARRPPARSMP